MTQLFSASRLGAIAILALTTIACYAHADTSAVPADKLAKCPGVEKAKAVAVGDKAAYVAAGDRAVFFDAADDGSCEVFSLAKPQVTRKVGTATVVAAHAAQCSSESCPYAIALRGAHGVPRGLFAVQFTCDAGFDLQPFRLVAGHDDLKYICKTGAGAGWSETQGMIAVGDDGLKPFIYSVETGSYIAVSPAEKKAGEKPSCPVGSLEVERQGDGHAVSPLLRVVEVKDDAPLQNGRGKLPVHYLVVDMAQREVSDAKDHPDTSIDVDAKRQCH